MSTDQLQDAIDRAVEEYKAGAIDKVQLTQRLKAAMLPAPRPTRMITLRLTDGQHERIRHLAAAARLSMNAWIMNRLESD